MLVQTREQFDAMCNAVASASVIAFDTEAEGLHLQHGDKTIGLSIYIPDTQQTFYVAWAHGMKNVNADYESIARWSQKKKEAYAYAIYQANIAPSVHAENVPLEWLNDLKEVWTKPALHIGHNTQFDLTALHLLGFPAPKKIADTMGMLSVVNSDWFGNVEQKYVPRYRMPDTGLYERGGRGLKFQARLWGLEKATEGIDTLRSGVAEMLEQIKHIGGDQAVFSVKDNEAAQKYLWMLKPSAVAQYAEDDTRLTYLLYEKLRKWGDKWQDTHVQDLYNDTTYAVWQMSTHGFKFDVERAKGLVADGEQRLNELSTEVQRVSGGQIENVGSPTQIVAYLREIGKNVTSSDVKTLSGLKDSVPAVALILEYRKLTKLISTYLTGWIENNVKGYVLPEFNVGGTVSGRLSSSSDMFGNFQNIPRTNAKNTINPKMLLFPPEGNIILDLDYQALEMRLIAWVAENVLDGQLIDGEVYKADKTLTRLIVSGEDMHAYTMRVAGVYDMLLKGLTESQYLRMNGYTEENTRKAYVKEHKVEPETQEQADADYFYGIARYKAKTTNFSSVYGIGGKNLAANLEITEEQGKLMLEGYHKAYPAVKKAMNYLQGLAMTPRPITSDSSESGMYIKFPLDVVGLRRKYMWYPTDKRYTGSGGYKTSDLDNAAWRAFSHLIQGLGGLIMQHAITRIHDQFGVASYTLDKFGDRKYDYSNGLIVPHVTVHDSYVPSLRPDDLYIVPEIVRLMEDYPVYPRLGVDVSAAPINGSWGETRKIDNLEQWIANKGVI